MQQLRFLGNLTVAVSGTVRSGGSPSLRPGPASRKYRTETIDCFLRSLAVERGMGAIGVILSGAVGDGAVRSIRPVEALVRDIPVLVTEFFRDSLSRPR
jgi:hypothetical protein